MAENKAKTASAPKKERNNVTVKIPITRDQQDDVFVSVNEHKYQIRRGAEVSVPDYIAEVLMHSEASDQEAMRRQAALQQRAQK